MDQLPLDIQAFTAMEELHMDRNQIVDVPPNMRYLASTASGGGQNVATILI